MRDFLAIFLISVLLSSCSETPEFSGRVAYVSFESESGGADVITRYDVGLPGTSTRLKEDVWVKVYQNWIHITLKNRRDSLTIVPRERVIQIDVGTKESNDLNVPNGNVGIYNRGEQDEADQSTTRAAVVTKN